MMKTRSMTQRVGIWVDHKEAILVSVTDTETTLQRIESHAESNFRPSGGWKASGTNVAQAVSKEQKAEERRRHLFHSFYHGVIEKIGKADFIYLSGPGEAKLELAKEVEKIKGPRGRIAAVEPSDRLTENQIVAKVKSFFAASEYRPGRAKSICDAAPRKGRRRGSSANAPAVKISRIAAAPGRTKVWSEAKRARQPNRESWIYSREL
ncbi:MAG: hypothetical protein P1P81_03305 [Desulfobulbales bacterium]|nr:hypothetical protein [Desulfobulbales bacterium]